mmetsp:Transcript_4808/g.3999  ORF Transcript_4808/g.3999 Transcript_4808/m.3999 type:complete len:94 (-) Transcript_4808:637-918(-)
MVNSVSFKDFSKRIRFAFRLYDLNDDGFITKQELEQNFKQFCKESMLALNDEVLERIVDAIFSEIDFENLGQISFEQFENFFTEKTGTKAVSV